MTAPALRPPAAAEPVPELDGFQRAALEAVLGPRDDARHAVIVGEAGAGKTTLVAALAVEATARGLAPDSLLVIAPTRAAGSRLGDRVSLLLDRPVGAPVVRTAASAAHAILTARAVALGEAAPLLVTGAEQDQLLRELLEGHARGEGVVPDWAGVVPPEATVLAGFRAELRDLLMRASESGCGPERLAALADAVGRPEWRGAAAVMDEYESLLAMLSSTPDQGERFDPAVVVAHAAATLERWETDLPGVEPPTWSLVVVDDAQDLTAAGRRLLDALIARGARVVLVGNADQSVQGYRGAVPVTLAQVLGPDAWGATMHRLGASHRQSGALAALTAGAVAHVGVLGAGSARRALVAQAGAGSGSTGDVSTFAEDGGAPRDAAAEPARGEPAAVPVEILAVSHRHAHSRAIAGALRAARHGLRTGPHAAGAPLDAPVPWGRMAVIARSSARLREIRGDLAAADIPCETLGEGTALHAEPAIAPLLLVMSRAAAAAAGEVLPWEEDQALELLGSRIVGIDPVAMRRLRRALVRAEREDGGARSSSELIVAALDAPEMWARIPTPEARLAARATQALRAAAEAAVAGAGAGRVAWAAWQALGVAEQWRDAALAGSARDDADLDAVIALLKAAELYTERLPSSSVQSFIDHLEGQEFAPDSLGARGRTEDAVAFCTPAGAAGREWDVVVVAGLEEGVWPDLRLRDSVLGAQHLADILAGRAPAEPIAERGRAAAARQARRAVLDDETRAFAVAVSRARSRVILACVDGEDSRPSRYLAWAQDATGAPVVRADATPGVRDLRAAVAAVRAGAVGDPDHGDPTRERPSRAAYVEAIARLARLGVAGADPRDWHGVPEPSSEVGMWDPDQPIRVSPSRLEALETCPLRWALESVGGSAATSEKQSLGTLVHEIAAALPAGTRAELEAALEERWGEIGGTGTWPDLVLRERADAMIDRLAGYVASVRSGEVRVEEEFSVRIGRAVIAGSADRVEVADGEARIVDLKTGAAITAAEAKDHAQLAMYQLAADHGAFAGVERASGAALVYIGPAAAQSGSVRDQAAIDVDKEKERLASAVDTMAGATFEAITNDRCGSCPVRRTCPAWPSGRQVTDG